MRRGRVVIVSSGEIYAAGLAVTLQERGWTIDGRFGTVDEVEVSSPPDLLLLDVYRDAGGVNAVLDSCRRFTHSTPPVRVLVITDVIQPDLFDRAMRAGLSGLSARDVPLEDLDRAAMAIVAGQTSFDRSFAVRSLQAQVVRELPGAMSEKDLVLVRHLAEGCSTDDIARRLGRSPSTVKLRVGDLKRRFGADNRAGLVYMAIKQGLI